MKLHFGNAVTTATTIMILILLGFIGYSVCNRENISFWGRRNVFLLVYGLVVCCFVAALSSNRVAADDNPMKLMSIAMRPLCEPPFPLERIEEMTALMGGEGSVK